MVATDSESIFALLHLDGEETEQQSDSTGTSMWKAFMRRIGKESLVEEYARRQQFEDIMLTEWIHEKLLPSKLETMERERNSGLIIQTTPDDGLSNRPIVEEGTIYRSNHPILLDEQVFHQSLVLILKSDERGIIGAILNRPSAKSAVLKNNKIPLRYGGRFGLENEGKPETWLHCGNKDLRNAKVGVRSDGLKRFSWKATKTNLLFDDRQAITLPFFVR